MIITPKNWASFQHYKNRSPAWIKLHRGLLDDFAFSRLPLASRALAPMLWLLASEYENGAIDATVEELAFRFRVSDQDMRDALTPLIESGFFIASETLARCKQAACLEKEDIEKVEKEEEKKMASADAPPDPSIPERDYFLRGREVLGKGAGGLIGKLLKAKGGNVALARSALETASTKQNATEYIAACCRDGPIAKPLTQHQQKQNELKGILSDLENFATGGSGSYQENPRALRYDPGERSPAVRGRAVGDLVDISPGGSSQGG